MINEKKNWRKRFWNSEKLIGISAMIISIGTLFVLVYQTRLIREQQYKSVYPHLTIMKSVDSFNKEYSIFVENNGIGPAIINNVSVFGNDTVDNVDLGLYLVNQFIGDTVQCSMSSLYSGMLIPENKKNMFFSLYGNNTFENYEKVKSFIESIDIIIEYESIYGEQWRLSYKENVPTKID